MTAIAESFNKADADTLGPDLSWTELAGDIDVVSNRARMATAGGAALARADSDLASADHYAQIATYLPTNNVGIGPIARKDSSATQTYYMAWLTYSAGYAITLYKVIAGGFTALGAGVSVTYASGDVVKIECNGSTIKAYLNGVEKLSRTDSDIATGTRTGMRMYDGTSLSVTTEADAFEAADLAATAASLVYFQPAIGPLLVR